MSSSESRGATFEILLPRCRRGRVTRRADFATAPATGGSKTVLLVEDDHGVRALAGRILRRAGYRVLEAAGGPAAMDVCADEGGRIDLSVGSSRS